MSSDSDLLRLRLTVGETAQDAPLRHVEPSGYRRDAGQHGRQPRHVRLHVTQQLFQLIQHWQKQSMNVKHESLKLKRDQTEGRSTTRHPAVNLCVGRR